MYTSPNMLLEIWDLGQDDFDYTVLAQNLAEIDSHDHSPGKGRQIDGGVAIVPASVTQDQMAPESIGNPQLQDNSVGASQLQDKAVTTRALAPGSVVAGPIPNAGITAPLLAPSIIPLGFVSLWWRPQGSSALPGGFWEVMDGRPWNQITNAWGITSGNIPDTRGRFALGADLTTSVGPAVGQTGGSSVLNLDHVHHTIGHAHSLPAHTHSIGLDGGHYHTWAGGYHMWQRANCFPMNTTVQGLQGHYHFNGFYSTYIKGLAFNPLWEEESDVQEGFPGIQHPLNDGQADMDSVAAHAHGGATGTFGGNSYLASDSTDVGNLGSRNITPSYTGLVYIMRVR